MAHTPSIDLAIMTFEGGYTVRVQSAFGVGELPPQPISLPLDLALLSQRRSDIVTYVERARRARLSGNEEIRWTKEFGGLLFESLFPREVLSCFSESRAKLMPGQRLRLRLRLPAALMSIPWELLYDKMKDEFLALARDIVVVRYPEMPVSVEDQVRVYGPLRVTVLLASPLGYQPIDLERELSSIKMALRTPIQSGQIVLDVVRGPGTLRRLHERLQRPIHVLHVICHGYVDEKRKEGGLVFEDESGDTHNISADTLRLQIEEQRGETRLVLLNACLGALPGGDDPFSSVGAALLRGGVPAVVAMQFEIAQDTAREFTSVFYAELVRGISIDKALSEARRHLYGYDHFRLDWAIPVLFLRGEDSIQFDIESPSSDSEFGGDASDLRKLWRRAVVAYFTKEWEQAEKLLLRVTTVSPNYEDVQAKLNEVRRQLSFKTLYPQISELRNDDQWQAVLNALDELERQQPGFPDPEGLRSWANARQRREQQFDIALDAYGHRDWEVVITALETLLTEFPEDTEASNLLTHAQQEQQAFDHPPMNLTATAVSAPSVSKETTKTLEAAAVGQTVEDEIPNGGTIPFNSISVGADMAGDDLAVAIPTRRSNNLRWLFVGLITLLLVGYLANRFLFNRGGENTAGNPTAVATTTVAGGGTGQDGTPAPTAEGQLGGTGVLTGTTDITPSTMLTDTTGTTPPAQPQPIASGQIPAPIANRNAQPVSLGTQLDSNGWLYTFPDASYSLVRGKQIGSFTAQGTYLHVLVWVANNTRTAQPIPAGFFALKDAQGNVYVGQPQVSSAAVQRGVNADAGMEDTIPANGALASVYLVFDVPPGAQGLFLFAAGKNDQGWPLNVVP